MPTHSRPSHPRRWWWAPRPTKLRSQRDINLWRIPLQLSLAAVGLFAITLIPDILDRYRVIHIPSWLTMGSIDDARAILAAMMGAVATVLALIFSAEQKVLLHQLGFSLPERLKSLSKCSADFATA